MKTGKWEVISSEIVLDSPWFRVRRDACRLPDGTLLDEYYVREQADYSVVFAVTADDMVILNRQYKHGIGEAVLELPGGALEVDESPLSSAQRELEEETGYLAESWEQVATFIADPTNATGRIYVFLARAAHAKGSVKRDVTEDIEVVLVPLSRVLDEVRSGRVSVQSHVAAIYSVLDYLEKMGQP